VPGGIKCESLSDRFRTFGEPKNEEFKPEAFKDTFGETERHKSINNHQKFDVNFMLNLLFSTFAMANT
jgi:hypothetical protein